MDDWQIGDLALCVDDTNLAMGLIRKGAIYRVTDISKGVHVKFGPQMALHFEGVDDFMGHAAIRFRKIRPLTDDEHDSFLADLDTPVSPAVPDGRRPVTAQRGTGHISPASALLACLPEPSAAHTPCLADGSGPLFNRAHEAEVDHG